LRRRNPLSVQPVGEAKEAKVAKPPKTTPHSDIDGVHQDERPNVESAKKAGQGARDLAKAHEKSKGRPRYATDGENREDRS
jgi:hypothetical protein